MALQLHIHFCELRMKYLHHPVSYSLIALSAFSASAFAQEQGRVISTTPVIQQVAVPRQVCTNEQVSTTSQNKSGGGALLGGIAGGAMGNAVGNGSGRAAATMIGIFGGAILGNHIEGGQSQSNTQNVQRCTTQTFYENRTTAYNVVYEFNGKQYQVQMPQDPGPFVGLQVTPVAPAVQPPPVIQPAPVIVQPVTQAPVIQPVFTQPVVIESYTTYAEHPRVVYVRPAPVIHAPVVYGHPHAHSHLHPHLQPQHLAYPHVRHVPRHVPHHGYRPHRPVVSIGFGGHFR
jgi:uncharacterized protein YcfJ